MYQYNKNKTAGRTYTDWKSTRGSSTQKLQSLPPITNTANGVRYYSSIDAEIYFGDIYVGEVTQIGWSIQQQTIPLYGYNSYTFDDVAVGSRIIQGQFAINFTERNFLTRLQSDAKFQKIARRMYSDDIPVADTASGQIYSDFRQKLHLPIWDKGFDLVIGFGEDPKSNNSSTYSTYLVINCVQVNGSSMQLDANGDPIQEIYTFIARDINEKVSDAAAANPASTSSETVDVEVTGKDLLLNGTIDLRKTAAQVQVIANNNITFTEGTYQLAGSLTDKSLSILNGLTADKINLIKTLSVDELAKYKKEFASKDSVKAVVKCKYTVNSSNSNKGKTEESQVTVNLQIKK